MEDFNLKRLAVTGMVASVLLTSACGSSASTPPASSAAPASAAAPAAGGSAIATVFADSFSGSYKGAWKSSTSGSGTAVADIAVDKAGGKLTFKLTLTGSDYGGTYLAPETFTAKFADNAATATGTSPTFGTYTLGITYVNYSQSGVVQMQCDGVPGGKVDSFVLQGEVTKAKMDLIYLVYFKSGGIPGQGTVTLTK
jgi:hypothetical protein